MLRMITAKQARYIQSLRKRPHAKRLDSHLVAKAFDGNIAWMLTSKTASAYIKDLIKSVEWYEARASSKKTATKRAS